MPIKLKLTEKAVQKLPPPTAKDREKYSDFDPPEAKRREAVAGLQLHVFQSGNKSFVLVRKYQGRSRSFTLGKFPDISVDKARCDARAQIANLRLGIDPIQDKRANAEKHVTLFEVYRDYLDVRGMHLSSNTKSNYKTVIETHLAPWRSKEMGAITRSMVQRKHAELTEISPSSANKAMRVLRALFNFANGQYEDHEGKGLFPDNPVSRLSHIRIWNREVRRQNKLNNSDLDPWFKAILNIDKSDPYAISVKDYLIMLLLTGMRRRELAPLRWADINFKDKILTVGKTKNGDPLLLPLSDYLFEMLRTRKQIVSGEYVFPGGQGNLYISEPKKHVDRLRQETGVYFTLHDLRRTFITIAESLDIPAFALKRLVNHRVKGDVTEGYIIMGVERLRKPMQQITDHILSLANVRKIGDVVPLKVKSN